MNEVGYDKVNIETIPVSVSFIEFLIMDPVIQAAQFHPSLALDGASLDVESMTSPFVLSCKIGFVDDAGAIDEWVDASKRYIDHGFAPFLFTLSWRDHQFYEKEFGNINGTVWSNLEKRSIEIEGDTVLIIDEIGNMTTEDFARIMEISNHPHHAVKVVAFMDERIVASPPMQGVAVSSTLRAIEAQRAIIAAHHLDGATVQTQACRPARRI